jgi:hypothetical protein
MQIWPIVKFYMRNEAAIDKLLSAPGTSNPAVINSAATILENLFPAQKALIADALATIREATAPSNYPDPNQS